MKMKSTNKAQNVPQKDAVITDTNYRIPIRKKNVENRNFEEYK